MNRQPEEGTSPRGRVYGKSQDDALGDDLPPILSAEEFVRLRESPEREDYLRPVREEVSLEILLDVIRRFPDHRETVVLNKFVPVEILDTLSTDEDWRIRYSIAEKRRLPEYLQLRLAGDPEALVRHAVVINAKATRRCLDALVDDPDEWVRDKARERIARGEFKPSPAG